VREGGRARREQGEGGGEKGKTYNWVKMEFAILSYGGQQFSLVIDAHGGHARLHGTLLEKINMLRIGKK
jgi:hypothetical protein